jgi:hypothetical protein
MGNKEVIAEQWVHMKVDAGGLATIYHTTHNVVNPQKLQSKYKVKFLYINIIVISCMFSVTTFNWM